MADKFWKDRPVLITGCTGLVGSWLTKYLLDRGAQVVGLIRDWVPSSNLILQNDINRITVVRGPIEDYQLLERTLNEYEIDTVFHLAAQTIVGTANRTPLGTFETNIKGTWNMLEAARRVSCVSRVVVASSDKAYGDLKTLPYAEDMPMEGLHPYDVSKSCTDLLSRTYFTSYKLPVCVTRCGNFYGGGDLNFNRLVPGTIRSVFNGQRPIVRSDGRFVRDYIYVEDAATAYAVLAEKMDNTKIHGQAFNFSNENQLNVLQMVARISKLMGTRLKPEIQDNASNEIRHQYLSAAKARKVLGWKPLFSLDSGLQKTIDWYTWFLQRESHD